VRATTVVVVPFSTTLTAGVASHIRLAPGETGLREPSEAQAENITVLRKENLQAPRSPLRRLGRHRLLEIARGVIFALDFLPEDLVERQ
jgi:mRNA-degrading endonuclease toxin of MazEF toxin-antitoxin module